jgi:hypothetical protein
MNHRWAVAALLSAGFLPLPGCHKHLGSPSVRASIVRSNFIFEATVEQVGGSTLPDYFKTGEETLIVRVTRAFTPEFQEFLGQRVTVSLLADSPLKAKSTRVGQTLAFLANPLFYGDTLAVEAEARRPSAILEQQLSERQQFQLQDRVKLAEVIIYGTVASIEKVPPQEQVSDFEHDPEWMRARVNVSNVVRGGELRQVDVFFPSSRDLIWYTSPRFHERQSGTWLLHRQSVGGRRNQREFVALHPLDFREGSTADAIRTLSRANPYTSAKTNVEKREGR